MPMPRRGPRWRYLSQTANLLSAVARTPFASDAEYWAYPSQALFDPIGARTAVLETDTAGNWVGSSYLWASVGDWARLGQLMLQDGRWNGAAGAAAGLVGAGGHAGHDPRAKAGVTARRPGASVIHSRDAAGPAAYQPTRWP